MLFQKNVLLTVKREGHIWKQDYRRGKIVDDLKKIGDSDENGTKVYFKPDSEIFEELVFDFEILAQRLRELAFLNKGIYIKLVDKRTEKEEIFHYEGGIKSFVRLFK